MGEEEKKKTEEPKKPEEAKQGKNQEPEKKAEESKEPPPPPPPQEIVLRVFMHCEGCAKKVRKCLKGFEGVENVETDCKSHKVVVKGEKADPIKVLERVQRKSHRQVELLSPIPKPPAPEEEKKPEEKEVAKPEEKKEEPQVITVVLKVHMHCEACAQEIKRRILKMKGVENVEPDLKSSQVTVRGVFEPPNLVKFVHKKTGKQALIVKQEEEKKEEEQKGKDGKEEKKAEDGGEKEVKKVEEAAKDGGGEAPAAPAPAEGEVEVANVMEMKRNEFYYNYPQNYQIYPNPQRFEFHSYPPQIFSVENPNACSVM